MMRFGDCLNKKKKQHKKKKKKTFNDYLEVQVKILLRNICVAININPLISLANTPGTVDL